MIQPKRVHHQTIVPSDTALHIKNTHTSKPIKVVIKSYDEYGKRISGNPTKIAPGRIYSIPLKNKFGSFVLRSLAKFTSRVE